MAKKKGGKKKCQFKLIIQESKMPIDIKEFAEPTLVRMKPRYGRFSEYKKDRFPDYADDDKRSWRGQDGWKQAGYNPNHQSTRVENVNLKTDDLNLKPY